jgi:hypothetical protein
MTTFRLVPIALLASMCILAFAAATPADEAPHPVVKLAGTILPGTGPIRPHTPLTAKISTTFASVPAGGDFVLQKLDYLFPAGAVTNGKLFPSCDAAKLARAHGRLSVCPKGSKIGSGVATGTAVAIGVTSSGKLTLFNGPGGKSITMNVDIVTPALINATFKAPLVRLKGKYALKLSVTLPDSLKTILGGDIVVSKIVVTTGATRMVNGVKRGYTEAVNCPKGGKGPFHADFSFNHDATTSADATLAC